MDDNMNQGNETKRFDETTAHTNGNAGTTGAAPETGPHTEEFRLSGEDIMSKVRQLIEEGNARRIIVRNADGHNLIEIPLTFGVVGAALLPIYAALGAAVALAANLTIVVEKR